MFLFFCYNYEIKAQTWIGPVWVQVHSDYGVSLKQHGCLLEWEYGTTM